MNSLKILVVDDDALVLLSTSMMIDNLGHRALEAGSAQQALAMLEGETFDLVITDHAMPEMTGVQLVRKLRDRYPELPYVLATGYAELPADCPPIPVKLGKPFNAGKLADAMKSALLGRKMSA